MVMLAIEDKRPETMYKKLIEKALAELNIDEGELRRRIVVIDEVAKLRATESHLNQLQEKFGITIIKKKE